MCVGFGNSVTNHNRTRYDSQEGLMGPKRRRANGRGRADGSAFMHASDRCSLRRYTAAHLLDELDALFDERIRFGRQIVPLLRLRCSDAVMRCTMIQRCDDATVATLPNVRVRAMRRSWYAAV